MQAPTGSAAQSATFSEADTNQLLYELSEITDDRAAEAHIKIALAWQGYGISQETAANVLLVARGKPSQMFYPKLLSIVLPN